MTPQQLASAIAHVDSDWAMIPVDARKRPVNPDTGTLQEDWAIHTYGVEAITHLIETSPHVRAVGLVLGPASGILAIDFDGNGSTAQFLEVFGRPWTDLPQTVSWSSGRPNRRQLAFRVPRELFEHLRGRRRWQRNGTTVLELRWTGHQSVIAGDHPDTAGYHWINSPEQQQVADAPEWLLEPLYRAPHESAAADYQPTAADAQRALALLEHIKPRDDYDSWLRVGMALHSVDPGLLSAWVDWSRGSTHFDEEECLAKWASFAGRGVTLGSLYYLARQDGWRSRRDPVPGRITLPEATGNGHNSSTGGQSSGGSGGQQPQQQPADDEDDPTYTELLDATLAAIEAQDVDAEMLARATLGGRFRRNDDQINAALFTRMRDRRVVPVQATADSVALNQIEGLEYLLDGWIIRGQLQLTYGPAGTGKTTLALAKALAVCRGKGLLDRSTGAEAGAVLYIATDSGPEALRKAIEDLGAEDDPHLHPGPDQRLFIWADAPEQGQQAWCSDVPGMVRLVSFIERHQIRYVIIDSAKAVTSRAGISYLSNEATATLLTFMAEVICRSLDCAIDIISHDGTANGSHSGAKAWSEIPSMVVALAPLIGDNNERLGVVAHFRKDRAAVIDPGRKVTFDLDREGCELTLAKGQEVVGNAEAAILAVLADAHGNDIASLSRKELLAEIARRFNRSHRTVDNTMPRLLKRRQVVKPSRGRFALSPSSQMRQEIRREAEQDTSLNYLSPLSGTSYPTPLGTTGVSQLPTPISGVGASGNSLERNQGGICPSGNSSNGAGQNENPHQHRAADENVPDQRDIGALRVGGAGALEPQAPPPVDETTTWDPDDYDADLFDDL